MQNLVLVTDNVSTDEKALGYRECDMPDVVGIQRRYEIIIVAREGKEYEYKLDLGPATGEDDIRIPSYNEHTVGQLRLMCFQLKLKPYDKLDLVGVNKLRKRLTLTVANGKRELANKVMEDSQ